VSNRALTAAFQHSVAKGTARLVILAMADEANDQGLLTAYRRSQSWLAKKANCDRGSVRRAIDTLESLGEVKVLAQGDGRESSDYQLVLPDLEPAEGVQDAAPAGAGRRARAGKARAQAVQAAPPIIPLLPVPSPSDPPAAPEAPSDPARELVDAFWKWCTEQGRPTPTLPNGGQGNPFMALVKIVRHLLDAGHPVAAVKVALTTTPAYTINALTLQINQRRPAAAGARAPITADRERPSGVVSDL
jgi:hypothetical protein